MHAKCLTIEPNFIRSYNNFHTIIPSPYSLSNIECINSIPNYFNCPDGLLLCVFFSLFFYNWHLCHPNHGSLSLYFPSHTKIIIRQTHFLANSPHDYDSAARAACVSIVEITHFRFVFIIQSIVLLFNIIILVVVCVCVRPLNNTVKR